MTTSGGTAHRPSVIIGGMALLVALAVSALVWSPWNDGDRRADGANRALELLAGRAQPACVMIADYGAGEIDYDCGRYRCFSENGAVNWGNGPVIEGADYYDCTRRYGTDPEKPWERCAVDDDGQMTILSRAECDRKAWQVPDFGDPLDILF